MKQIYNFENTSPPILNENIIRNKIQKKKKTKKLALFVLASCLIQASVLLFGYTFAEQYPYLEVLSLFYIAMSLTCGGVVAVLYGRKGGLR